MRLFRQEPPIYFKGYLYFANRKITYALYRGILKILRIVIDAYVKQRIHL